MGCSTAPPTQEHPNTVGAGTPYPGAGHAYKALQVPPCTGLGISGPSRFPPPTNITTTCRKDA